MEELEKPGTIIRMYHNIVDELDILFKIVVYLCISIAIAFGGIILFLISENGLNSSAVSWMNRLYIIIPLVVLYSTAFIGWPIYYFMRERIAENWLRKNAKITRPGGILVAPLRGSTLSRIEVTEVYDGKGRLIAKINVPLPDE